MLISSVHSCIAMQLPSPIPMNQWISTTAWHMTLGKVGFFGLSFFWGLHPRHMEVARVGVKSELQLPAYATDTATQDLSRIFDLHRSSQQSQILNPLSKGKVRIRVLMDASWIHHWWAMTGTPWGKFLKRAASGMERAFKGVESWRRLRIHGEFPWWLSGNESN